MKISESLRKKTVASKESDEKTGEGPFWNGVGGKWRQLYGNFARLGVSFEWHRFESRREVDWAKSFHPESVEICLNDLGAGYVRSKKGETSFRNGTAGFYAQGPQALDARRVADETHQFITVEFSSAYLTRHLAGMESALNPVLLQVMEGKEASGVSDAMDLGSDQRALFTSLSQPPVPLAAQALWYQSKAMELMARLFVESPAEPEFFCTRQKIIARDRVAQVIDILKQDLSEPPSLEEIGARAGCSPFYLSRTFSKEMGMGIPQYLRQLRLEKAADLLKSGEYNVTEAAVEVGYSSLSHFSQAFHQRFGCCPGLYPLKTLGLRKV